MRALSRRIETDGKADECFRLYPLGDVHVGASGCDETMFAATVAEIEADPCAYWVGMGDYIDAIRRNDPRFSIDELAEWVTVPDLRDLAAAQRARFLEMTRPIWPKCLALLSGNHEESVLRWDERDVYHEIVSAIKPETPHENLTLGYTGFLRLTFGRLAGKTKRPPSTKLDVWTHHGHGGGRLEGAKALTMQRAMWAFDADLHMMGNTHSKSVVPGAVVALDRAGRVVNRTRLGVWTGTYMRTWDDNAPGYAEKRLYWANATGSPVVELRPWLRNGQARSHSGFAAPGSVRVLV